MKAYLEPSLASSWAIERKDFPDLESQKFVWRLGFSEALMIREDPEIGNPPGPGANLISRGKVNVSCGTLAGEAVLQLSTNLGNKI
jgi:hypothetical protein